MSKRHLEHYKCRIWGSHTGLLGYNTTQHTGRRACLLRTSFWFLTWLTFNPEDGGDMFLRNVEWLSADYTALYPRSQNYSYYKVGCIKSVSKDFLREFRRGKHCSLLTKAAEKIRREIDATVTMTTVTGVTVIHFSQNASHGFVSSSRLVYRILQFPLPVLKKLNKV
jgi:hypothetical protein